MWDGQKSRAGEMNNVKGKHGQAMDDKRLLKTHADAAALSEAPGCSEKGCPAAQRTAAG